VVATGLVTLVLQRKEARPDLVANPCAPNVSQPNPTYSNVVIFTALSLASYLNNKGMGWAYGIAPALGTLTYNLPTFCAADPPILTVPTAADILGWFNPLNPQGAAQLRDVMGRLVSYFLWYDLCQCSAGPALVPPAPVAEPAGQQTNPPALTGNPAVANCGVSNNNVPNSAASITVVAYDATGFIGQKMNFNATQLEVIAITSFSGIGAAPSWTWSIVFFDANGQQITSVAQPFMPNGATKDQILVIPVGTRQIDLFLNPSNTTAGGHFVFQAVLWCGVNPGATQQPCCPPDTVAQQIQTQILQMVTLIQRQLVPFAYVASTVHAGLANQGSFAIADRIGVAVNLTTIPASYGEIVAEPTYHVDMGWLSILTADGFIEEVRITRQTQVWMPRLFGEAVLLGYSLNPGVVATLTELVRES